MNNLCMLFIITNYNEEKRFLKVINKKNIGFKFIMHGIGMASYSLLEYFGLTEEKKVIITSILPKVIAKKVLMELETKLNLDVPGKGIAFTIPLSSTTKYMLDFYQEHEMEDIEMKEANQHLIVTITNEGFAEKVMDVAQKNGATGGTTLNGRGLDSEKVVKFLNISIEPEKDIILILVPTDKKNDIMNAIISECGLKTPGAGICFSLPVDHAVGLNKNFNK